VTAARRIDGHVHLWKVSRGDYDWMTPDLTALYRDFDVSDLAPLLDAAEMDQAVLVQAAETLAECDFLLDIAAGSDRIAGVVGWVAGYTNAFPSTTVELYELAVARDIEQALPLYRMLHPLLRWDSKTEFVQAIKYSMDMAGRKGGACRAPRMALTSEQAASVRRATEVALAAGAR